MNQFEEKVSNILSPAEAEQIRRRLAPAPRVVS